MPKTDFTRFLSWSNVLLSSRGAVQLFIQSLPPQPFCYHVLMVMWSWPFLLPTLLLTWPLSEPVQFVNLSESFWVSFLPVKQLNLIPWWETMFPSPCMAWIGHGKALLKAMRQQNNISTVSDTWGTLLSELNVATHSRCPSDTWIPQHTPKQPGLWPGAGPVIQCILNLDSPVPLIPMHALGIGLNSVFTDQSQFTALHLIYDLLLDSLK